MFEVLAELRVRAAEGAGIAGLFVVSLLLLGQADVCGATPPLGSAEEVLFRLHVPDLKRGQAVVVDYGDKEIIIDAGSQDFYDYLADSGIVDGPIELVIVTHAHSDHYSGLEKILSSYEVLEYWDPGYDYSAERYQRLIDQVREQVPTVRRPLRSVGAGEGLTEGETFLVGSLPGVEFTALHAPVLVPTEPFMEGVRLSRLNINNTSLVLKLEIEGVRMLFPGDAEGEAAGAAYPSPIEPKLVALNDRFPGILRSEILIAPFHGSASSSTEAFVEAVDPHFVLFSAALRFGLPRKSVLNRYFHPARALLSTDRTAEPSLDHIVLTVLEGRRIRHQFLRSAEGHLAWEGKYKDKAPLTEECVGEIMLWNRRRLDPSPRSELGLQCQQSYSAGDLSGADLTGVHLSGVDFREMDLSDAVLRGAVLEGDLRGASLVDADLSHADLRMARLSGVDFSRATLVNAILPSDLTDLNLEGANLSWAVAVQANFSGSRLKSTLLESAELVGFRMIGGEFHAATMQRADLTDGTFEPDPGPTFPVDDLALATYLATLSYDNSPHGLVTVREALKKAGLRKQERQVTYAIESTRQSRAVWPERIFSFMLFDVTCAYGKSPGRPLWLLVVVWALSCLLYYLCVRCLPGSGIRLVVTRRSRNSPGEYLTRIYQFRPTSSSRLRSWVSLRRLAVSEFRLLLTAAEFSLRSALNLKFRWFEAGTWVRLVHRREFELEPYGWTRTISGVQALVSLYLVAIWILSYFGRPFG